MTDRSSSSLFPATRWSLVVSSRGEDTRARMAMEELCRAYWYPIYAFVRGMGVSPNDAEDMTQGFFERLVDQDIMGRVPPNAGRLRSYLITSLKNFVAQTHRHATSQKRGGGAKMLSFDGEIAEGRYREETIGGSDPQQAFERRWAVALLDAAIDRLRRDYAARGEEARIDALLPLLVDSERGVGYREAAQALEISEGAVRVAVFRLRKRFRTLLRDEIAETVADPAEIDAEIEALFAVLSG